MVHVLAFVATALAAATAVHNDPLPPPTDDWLVRPIRRIDMMLAKVLFFLVAIEGPIFLGSLAASIGLGLGLPQAIYPAIVHACATAVWFGLFSLGLGAVTSNVVEALVGGFACLVLFVLMFFTGNAFGGAANYGENSRAIVIGALTAGIAVSGLLAFVSQFHQENVSHLRAIALTFLRLFQWPFRSCPRVLRWHWPTEFPRYHPPHGAPISFLIRPVAGRHLRGYRLKSMVSTTSRGWPSGSPA